MNADAPQFTPQLMRRRDFHFFTQLQEELVVNILSFLANVPYEKSSTDNHSSLTHTFPLVSKQFNLICRDNDYLWAIAVERLIKNEDTLWGAAIKEFIDDNSPDEDHEDRSRGLSYSLQLACHIMQNMIRSNGMDTKYGIHGELYRYVLSNHIRYIAPVFYMPDETITRGRPFGLHFFEPRYRRLINEVMAPYPEEFRNGRVTSLENGITSPPTFIYGNRSPLKRGQAAIIVQVVQCFIRDNGAADVFLLPLEHGRIEQVWEQVNYNDHLYVARLMKMGEEEQNDIETNDVRRIALEQHRAHGEDIPVQAYVNEVLRALGRGRSQEEGDESDS